LVHLLENGKLFARFGHTINFISDENFVIFGGAIEISDKIYEATNDCLVGNVLNRHFIKLKSKIIRQWCNSLQ